MIKRQWLTSSEWAFPFDSGPAVPHPDIFCYSLNSMSAPKNWFQKLFLTLFPSIFYIKTQWKSLQVLRKQKHFQETQMCFTNDIKYWIFSDAQPPPWVEFGCRPYTDFEKTVCPEIIWMQHASQVAFKKKTNFISQKTSFNIFGKLQVTLKLCKIGRSIIVKKYQATHLHCKSICPWM